MTTWGYLGPTPGRIFRKMPTLVMAMPGAAPDIAFNSNPFRGVGGGMQYLFRPDGMYTSEQRSDLRDRAQLYQQFSL
jgi:hypothetical protein